MTSRPALTVVIPVLNEASRLPGALGSVPPGAEIVVADGGSADGSPGIARRRGGRCLVLPGRSRGALLNAGAAAAAGGALVFLHADTRLPAGAGRLIAATLAERGVAGGAFSLSFEGAGTSLGLIAAGANARSRLLGLPYGDQALFLRRETFTAIGGFPDWPLLEDVGLIRRLRTRGRLVIRPERVVTSPRRYRHLGAWHAVFRNGVTLLRFVLGTSPWTLAHAYASVAPSSGSANGRAPTVPGHGVPA